MLRVRVKPVTSREKAIARVSLASLEPLAQNGTTISPCHRRFHASAALVPLAAVRFEASVSERKLTRLPCV